MVRSKVTKLCLAFVMAALSVCSTGCMVWPQHGEVFGSTDEDIDFWGATVHAGERLSIQARRPGARWVVIGDATTSTSATELESGTWYLWHDGRVRVPYYCWSYAGDGLMAAEIRIVSLDHDISGDARLLTFRNGFQPLNYVDPYDMWTDYGHGRTITIYAPS